jgi:hypothetical protein
MKALAFLILAPAQAGAFTLSFPLDCTLNETCFIQQYTDSDPSPAASDYTCGSLSYDGHKGTDFSLPTLLDMEKGVAVLAAAPGTVRATRDGMPDIASNAPNAPDIANKECGNAVVITHADGWETQYCHLKRNSVRVTIGQTVGAGTSLGEIGLSGNTEFPHLHLSLRQNGAVMDPFSPGDTATCGTQNPGLWSPTLPYRAGGLIGAGFAADVPSFDAVKAGTATTRTLPATAPAIVVWAHIFGSRVGDTLSLEITGPQGSIITKDLVLDRTQARAMRAIGKRLRGPSWPTGAYTGIATLSRAGETIGQIISILKIEP